MRDTDFFSRLYAGFEAEHFVTGKLFGAGLEAFKLPADFGFDLLVSNQKEVSIGAAKPISRAFPFPYAIQVKSRRIQESHFCDGPHGRSQALVNFRLSKSEFEMLSTEDRSYLACVAFPPAKEISIANEAICFWLKGTQLAQLRTHSYLQEVVDGGRVHYDLQVGYRSLPTVSREALLGLMQKQGDLTERGAKELGELLPKQIHKGWGHEYIALYRCPWSQALGGYHGDRNVAKKLNAIHLDLSGIGSDVSFPTTDSCERFPVIAQ